MLINVNKSGPRAASQRQSAIMWFSSATKVTLEGIGKVEVKLIQIAKKYVHNLVSAVFTETPLQYSTCYV